MKSPRPLPFPSKIEQIFFGHGQSLLFQRVQDEGTHRHVCISRKPLQLAPLTTVEPLPRRVLLVTHNLNLEGAPLFFVDYAGQLAKSGATLTVLSPADGPLRSRFEACGAQVKLVETSALFGAQTGKAAREALLRLGRDFDFAAFDLVVANTFTTFWAVHAAKAAGRRVLMYVHESTTPASFYLGRVHPEVVALVDEALALADCVSFTTASTRSYHLDYGRPPSRIVPRGCPSSWIHPGQPDLIR